ncbi:sensory rhodopsin transducer [Stenotrophomonas sp. AR026]|uniref:sensory rhodopsin transducer n=1 Tax=Stenotrophomonas sp. AR026 TaxID=3398462 RepID=UPI003BAE436D
METNASCIGHRRWAIAEGYIPAWSNGPSPEMQSHETCCVLNAGHEPAHVTLTLYFEDRDPVGPYRVTVPARRTCHLRFNDLQDPAPGGGGGRRAPLVVPALHRRPASAPGPPRHRLCHPR